MFTHANADAAGFARQQLGGNIAKQGSAGAQTGYC
jgi:hypothetical protein